MSKGFVFSIDAMLSVLVLMAIVTSIMYFSSSKSSSDLPLLDMERKGSDMLIVLDKTGILDSGNTTAIAQAVNQTLVPNLAWNITVEHYNYTFNLGSAWANSSFDRCRNIVITNAGTTALTNFPAYVNVTHDVDMLSNYSDLRFYGGSCGNGGSLLDYEIENYTAASASVWIRIPTLAAGDTTISVYYKNNTAVGSGQNISGVWDSNSVSTWHLDDNPAGTAPQMKDSKGAYNGTTISMTSSNQVPAQIDGGLDFNGVNNSVNCTDMSPIDGATQLTVSAWIKVDNLALDSMILSKGTFAANQALLFWYDTTTTTGSRPHTISIQVGTGSAQVILYGSANLTNDNNWHYVTATYVGGSTTGLRLYVDGKEDAAQSPMSTATVTALASTTTPVYIGMSSGGTQYFNGTIDEVRVSNVARSAAWINQSYQMESNQDGYVSFGTALARGVPIAFALDQNSTLGSYDSNATGEAVAYRAFVVRNASTGLIDQYGRAILKVWSQ
jgi:hypothetical protein